MRFPFYQNRSLPSLIRTVLLRLWLGLCAASPLLAQEENKHEEHQATGRVAWFVYTSMPEGLENPVSVMTGKDIIQLTLSKRAASVAVKIPADGILRIVRKVANPADPAKPKYLILAQANIADSVHKALIILVPVVPSPGSDLLFQAKVQDLVGFKGGDSLYLNLTKLGMRVELGGTKLEVKPGETIIYKAPTLDKPANTPICYSFYHPTEKQWKMISASTIVLYPTRREICIFSWDPRYNRVEYHGITFPVTPDDNKAGQNGH